MSEVIESKRPSRFDKRYNAAVAEALMPKVIEWLGSEHDGDDEFLKEQIVEALDRAFSWDGFRIAKALDGWDADMELAEILDDADWIRTKEHRKAVTAWVKEHGIVPNFAIGSLVSIEHQHQMIDGEIAHIDTEQAEYTVFCESLGHVRDGLGTHGVILPFEKVKDRVLAF